MPTHYNLQQLTSLMNYLSTFFQIEQTLKLQHLGEAFSLILDSSDLIILISNYLNVYQLLNLLSINKKARQLLSIPLLQVRLLKGELRKLKNGGGGDLMINSLRGLGMINTCIKSPLKMNVIYNLNNFGFIKGFYSHLLNKRNQKESSQLNWANKQFDNNSSFDFSSIQLANQKGFLDSQKIQAYSQLTSVQPYVKQQIIQKVTWIDIHPPSISQTFSSIHTEILNSLEDYYEHKQIQLLKSKSLKQQILKTTSPFNNSKNQNQMFAFFNKTVAKIQNFVEMVRFVNK